MHCMTSTVGTAATLWQGIVYMQWLHTVCIQWIHCHQCTPVYTASVRAVYTGYTTVYTTTHCTSTALRAGMVIIVLENIAIAICVIDVRLCRHLDNVKATMMGLWSLSSPSSYTLCHWSNTITYPWECVVVVSISWHSGGMVPLQCQKSGKETTTHVQTMNHTIFYYNNRENYWYLYLSNYLNDFKLLKSLRCLEEVLMFMA